MLKMRTLFLAGCLLAAPLPMAMAEQPSATAGPPSIVLDHCLVSLVEQVIVPAQEAGLLLKLEAREGDVVAKGARLAQMDDRQAQAALQSATAEHARARHLAENDIDVRYAQAAADVAAADHQAALETNLRARNAVGESELRRLKLAQQRAELGVEQAKVQMQSLAFERDTHAAHVQGATLAVERRQVVSPLEGVVVEIHKRAGEWLQAGEPILKVVRMNRLRVEGFLRVPEIGPHQVAERPVSVEVKLDNGRVEVFSGRVEYVNPIVHAGGQYRVWAEVENRQEHGQYLLRPGHEAQMTIELKSP